MSDLSSGKLAPSTSGASGAFRWRRAIAALLVAAASASSVAFGARTILPKDGAIAQGIRVGGSVIQEGTTPSQASEAAARRILDRRIQIRWLGASVLDVSLADIGAEIDVDAIAERIRTIGHEGDIFARLDDSLLARAGLIDIPVFAFIPIETLATRLERVKDEGDTPPSAAKLRFEDRKATEHSPGRSIDIYAAAAAIEGAIKRGEESIELPVLLIAPRASSDVVAKIDISQVVASFETRFGYVGNQVGRAQNVTRAANGMDGVVLLPGEVVSFNANVGPRSVENGFTTAPEIYKGELREGVGGGTCQVAGTLHAAAFLGGFDIVERANHSRPSGYIKMGLDATVVYPTVDLKLRNPYKFPVVIHGSINKGALVFQLLGQERPATVEMTTATIGVAPFKRKIEEDTGVKEGAVILKQKGIKGFTVRKVRTIKGADGGERVEVSTDVYPPTFEIWRVRPGTDADSILPPLGEPPPASGA